MKSEFEKQQSGELYDAHTNIFKLFKKEANAFLMEYNSLPYNDAKERRDLLVRSLGSIGNHVTIGTPFLCDFARNIHIGNNVSVNMNCSFMDSAEIRIDDETMIAPNVQIYTGTHPIKLSERLNPQWQTHNEQHFVMTRALPVHISQGCWIGGGTIILPGVTIGKGSVIGAGSVVVKNIPDHVVAVGNPCKVIKEIEEN
ncbi:putative acetyltransferase [Oenococcus oeni]|uniref:sugar O-acetyltransferase n=1 Tax=Oenococcus oeni TaxID=1247 RepID=UPI0010B4C4B4|nr:sugar O-acetyltransferase [Oenococcus oeni]MDV7686103.1 sugar O-acetyltransferase [Oenococcus oeni]SYW05380.1 putative acetyltransferase [Oenococcus oeni]